MYIANIENILGRSKTPSICLSPKYDPTTQVFRFFISSRADRQSQ